MTEFLCNSLGYSKQAYYKSLRSSNEGEERERYVLSIVEEIRRDMPRLGVLKLWKMLNDNGLEVGRDWLFRLLHRHNLMVKMKKYRVITTDSRAWRRQYPNLDSEGPVKALYRALENGENDSFKNLIHHSDRGGQYCSAVYTGILKLHHVSISMTQDGSPYDNAIAERVNGVLKREWLNDISLKDINDARKHVERIIQVYNKKRPHLAVLGMVPEQAHRDKKKKFARVMF